MTNDTDFDWTYEPSKTGLGKAGVTFGPVSGDPKFLEAIVRDTNKRTWRTLGLLEQPPKIPAPPRLPRIKARAAAKRQIYDALREAGSQRITITRDDGKQDAIFGHVATPEGLEDVMLTDQFVKHLVDDHPGQTRGEFANLILPSLTNPAEVWLQPHLIHNRIIYRRAFIAFFENRNTVTVTQKDWHGHLSWTFHPASTVNRSRKGHLLFQR